MKTIPLAFVLVWAACTSREARKAAPAQDYVHVLHDTLAVIGKGDVKKSFFDGLNQEELAWLDSLLDRPFIRLSECLDSVVAGQSIPYTELIPLSRTEEGNFLDTLKHAELLTYPIRKGLKDISIQNYYTQSPVNDSTSHLFFRFCHLTLDSISYRVEPGYRPRQLVAFNLKGKEYLALFSSLSKSRDNSKTVVSIFDISKRKGVLQLPTFEGEYLAPKHLMDTDKDGSPDLPRFVWVENCEPFVPFYAKSQGIRNELGCGKIDVMCVRKSNWTPVPQKKGKEYLRIKGANGGLCPTQ